LTICHSELAGDRPRLAAQLLPALMPNRLWLLLPSWAHDRFAPTGFQGGLGHQVTRIDTDALGRRSAIGSMVDEFVG
jgi:hypothetical protein